MPCLPEQNFAKSISAYSPRFRIRILTRKKIERMKEKLGIEIWYFFFFFMYLYSSSQVLNFTEKLKFKSEIEFLIERNSLKSSIAFVMFEISQSI